MKPLRIVLGLIVAMAITVFAFPIGACVAWQTGLVQPGHDCLEALTVFAFYGPLFVVPSTLLFGLPLLLLAYRRRWLRWWQLALIGALVGLLAAITINLFLGAPLWYRLAVLSVPVGTLGGLAYWLIATDRKLSRQA